MPSSTLFLCGQSFCGLGNERIRSAEFCVDPFAPLLSAVSGSVESRSYPASGNRMYIVHATRAAGKMAVDCSSAHESCLGPCARAARAFLCAAQPDLRFPEIGLVVSSCPTVYRCLPPWVVDATPVENAVGAGIEHTVDRACCWNTGPHGSGRAPGVATDTWSDLFAACIELRLVTPLPR